MHDGRVDHAKEDEAEESEEYEERREIIDGLVPLDEGREDANHDRVEAREASYKLGPVTVRNTEHQGILGNDYRLLAEADPVFNLLGLLILDLEPKETSRAKATSINKRNRSALTIIFC